MELENGNMEIDIPNGSNGDLSVTNEHGLVLWTVPINASGEGLPYAPIDWPDHGDNWSWKVGNRVTVSGYFLDRYLYPPLRFQKSTRRKKGYASKLSVAQYIRSGFPGKDVDAFFSSFSWKIPSEKLASMKGNKEGPFPLSVHSEERPECSPSTSNTLICEAKNKMCDSLVAEGNNIVSMAMPCDLCCSEPGFCRYCCCILCCKTVSSSFGGYSYIKCASSGDKGYICGHIAHVDCALRSYMAGTVGGSIGLDAEYHCRRCDARTELVSHVRKIKRACSSIGSRDEIEKILDVGICVLRGSKKETARKLLNCIESAKSKDP